MTVNPSKLNYSYANTAYSTDPFDFQGTLLITLTFKNNSQSAFGLSKPDVWTSDGNLAGPDEDYNNEFPSFQLTNIPQQVNPNEEFVIQGIIDLTSVKSGNKYLTIRPQFFGGGWVADEKKDVPIISAKFICLPSKEKTQAINKKS
ncbi:hypothetical protein [Serratia fonticola]|uniref:hypothetical protein n=1 Tax=Serratia fonticola TaxID=47917 RepID=UPI00301D3D4C